MSVPCRPGGTQAIPGKCHKGCCATTESRKEPRKPLIGRVRSLLSIWLMASIRWFALGAVSGQSPVVECQKSKATVTTVCGLAGLRYVVVRLALVAEGLVVWSFVYLVLLAGLVIVPAGVALVTGRRRPHRCRRRVEESQPGPPRQTAPPDRQVVPPVNRSWSALKRPR